MVMVVVLPLIFSVVVLARSVFYPQAAISGEEMALFRDLMIMSPGDIVSNSSVVLHDDLALSGYASQVWEGLLNAASDSTTNNNNNLAVVEVGMHRATQCLQAAKIGFEAHCIEPSPNSFHHIATTVKTKASAEVQKRIHLYNLAAGSADGATVPFVASGGTGDHVGEIDMWNMKPLVATTTTASSSKEQVIQVPVRSLDSVLQEGTISPNTSIYLLKVDTQGYEPHVFAGLTHLLLQHRIDYILTEFWPRGMDILDGKTQRECIGVTKVLQPLVQHGYRLYVLPVEGHPKSPAYRHLPQLQKTRPLVGGDLHAYCQWYYQLEDRFPSDEYKMGYWTDILALAPGVELPKTLRQLPTYA